MISRFRPFHFFLFFALLGAFLLASCHKKQQTALASGKTNGEAAKASWSVTVGSGGGFTGGGVRYIINSDGQLFRLRTIPTDSTFLRQLDTKELKSVKKMLDDADLKKNAPQQPGNMTYFIHYQPDKEQTYSAVWGDHRKTTPEQLKKLYKDLLSFINDKPSDYPDPQPKGE